MCSPNILSRGNKAESSLEQRPQAYYMRQRSTREIFWPESEIREYQSSCQSLSMRAQGRDFYLVLSFCAKEGRLDVLLDFFKVYYYMTIKFLIHITQHRIINQTSMKKEIVKNRRCVLMSIQENKSPILIDRVHIIQLRFDIINVSLDLESECRGQRKRGQVSRDTNLSLFHDSARH